MHRRGAPSAFVISQTPFRRDGAIDWDATRAHLARLRDSAIGVYVGGGGSGEGHALLADEVGELLAVAGEELSGAVPVRAMGVEPRTAKQMIDFGTQVRASGIDAMQIYSLDMGHLGRPSRDEIEAFFTDVLENIDVAAVLSTHFSVGYMVPVEVLCALCERFDSIVGINCSIGSDFTYLVRLLDEVPAHVEVHVGGPMHALSALAMGATGFLSSEGNLAPALVKSVVDHYAVGEYRAAEEAYAKVMLLFEMATRGPGSKALQNALGLPGGHLRRPRLDGSTPAALEWAIGRLAEIGVPELDALVGHAHQRPRTVASPTP